MTENAAAPDVSLSSPDIDAGAHHVTGDEAVQQDFEDEHLHPLTLLVSLPKVALNLIPALIAAFVALPLGKYPLLGLIILPILLLVLGIAYLQWRRFTYRLEPNQIVISSGILSRQIRSIPYDRIQDVNLERSLLARLFGLAVVKLETGSGKGDEGTLEAVSLERAEALRDTIRHRKFAERNALAASQHGEVEKTAVDEAENVIFQMDSKRVLLAGIFSFSLAVFAIIGALLQNLDFLIPDNWFNPRMWLARMAGVDDMVQQFPLVLAIIAFLSMVITLVVIGLASGIITSLLRNHHFTLARNDNGLRRQRGLLTLTDMVMPLRRIQAAIIETGPVKKRFGWYVLKFQSLASDGKNNSNHEAAPLAHDEEIRSILSHPRIDWEQDFADMRPVHPVFGFAGGVFFTLLAIIVISANAMFWKPVLLWLLIPVILLISLYFILRWYCHRFSLQQSQLYVHNGVWKRRLTILPLRKIQSIDLQRGPLERIFGLSSLTFGVAGGSGISVLSIHAIEHELAQQLRREMLPHACDGPPI